MKLGLSVGVLAGIVVEIVAAPIGLWSAGAGHGGFVLARWLFPLPLLIGPFDPAEGAITMTVAALQYPLYGALAGWCVPRRAYAPVAAVALLHLVAAIACFTGLVPGFE